jgi:protein-tyrosine-phosphatase
VAGLLERVLTRVLTHPATMAVKRPVRDAIWRVRGRGLARAPLAADPRTLLFICKGNICRSPFAERLAARLLAEAGVEDVRCVSAGFQVSKELASPVRAVEAAQAFGISLGDHRATQLTPEIAAAADLIVVTEAGHVDVLRERYPNAAARIVLLPLYGDGRASRGAYARYNIADPYGKSAEVFGGCYRHIADALGELVRLVRRGRG